MDTLLNAKINWHKFRPEHLKMQLAGNQGLVSLGPGYNFLDHRFEIDLMYGYTPESIGGCDIHSFSIKRSVLFLQGKPRNRWDLQVSAGITTIYTVSQNTYLVFPDHYPDGYYSPNIIHNQLFLGLRVDYNSPDNPLSQKISVYYEVGMLDDHLDYLINTKRGNAGDKVNLALGMTIDLRKLPK
jgi:hypothetical protein